MAYQNTDDARDYQPRKMHQGDWSCSQCGAPINELPFQPDPSRLGQLVCRDCHKKRRPMNRTGGDGQRQMFQGNWQCATCQAPINELPFQPDPSRLGQLKCRDCHRNGRS